MAGVRGAMMVHTFSIVLNDLDQETRRTTLLGWDTAEIQTAGSTFPLQLQERDEADPLRVALEKIEDESASNDYQKWKLTNQLLSLGRIYEISPAHHRRDVVTKSDSRSLTTQYGRETPRQDIDQLHCPGVQNVSTHAAMAASQGTEMNLTQYCQTLMGDPTFRYDSNRQQLMFRVLLSMRHEEQPILLHGGATTWADQAGSARNVLEHDQFSKPPLLRHIKPPRREVAKPGKKKEKSKKPKVASVTEYKRPDPLLREDLFKAICETRKSGLKASLARLSTVPLDPSYKCPVGPNIPSRVSVVSSLSEKNALDDPDTGLAWSPCSSTRAECLKNLEEPTQLNMTATFLDNSQKQVVHVEESWMPPGNAQGTPAKSSCRVGSVPYTSGTRHSTNGDHRTLSIANGHGNPR